MARDVTLDDRSDRDLPLFQQTFKAVESGHVVKSPLSPFDALSCGEFRGRETLALVLDDSYLAGEGSRAGRSPRAPPTRYPRAR